MDETAIKEAVSGAGESAPEVKMTEEEVTVERYVAKRVGQMQGYRQSLKVEERWREADREYEPSELDITSRRRRFESDDETGLRSRIVKVGDGANDWRSNKSDPVLLTKIQTAISIIINGSPEAKLTAVNHAYQDRVALSYALWKRNWIISDAESVYKKFVFNLAKYGWAPGKTYPCRIAYDKEVLVEVDDSKPYEKNRYEKRTNVWFNDVKRENLDPFRTWIDEQTEPYDQFSTNDWYYEKDFSFDAAKAEFGKYANFDKLIPKERNLRKTYDEGDSKQQGDDEQKERTDLITIGFYENRLKDMFVIRVPALGAIIHHCPLPNDDGMLSLWHTPWVLRSATNPYGISLWEIIKQKKGLYDKFQNMTMDQLVLSIMKMFFYTGTSSLVGDGKISIEPGKGVQVVNGKVDWMEVPGPGEEAWKGLQFLKNGMDDDSGVTPTLQGAVTGQTLGEVLQAKESALKRLKVPVENIADAIEQDAYVTLSWMSQVYSTPEVKLFTTPDEITAYEIESGTGVSKIVASSINPESNEAVGPYSAAFLPKLGLQLEESGGKLVESRTDRFFQVGKDFEQSAMKWRGLFKVVPKSIVSSSEEIEKQRKLEVFNIMAPLLGQSPELYAKPVRQLLIVNDQNPIDWLPKSWLDFLEQNKQQLFISPQLPAQVPGMGKGVPSNQTSMQGASGTTPGIQAPTVVPQQQLSVPQSPGYSGNQRNELTRAVQ